MITLTIDNRKIQAPEGKTVLEAAIQAGIYIPNLCYHPDIPPLGACRLCIVEIEGMKGFPTACTTMIKEGMIVSTNTPGIHQLRKSIVWFIMSEYPETPDKSSQLQQVVQWTGIADLVPGYTVLAKDLPIISDEPLFNRNLNLCILCGRCVRMCQEIRGIGAIGLVNRGIHTLVGTSYDLSMENAGCKFCTACVEVCPSGALADKEPVAEQDRNQVLLPCSDACPAGIDIPRYIRLLADDRSQDAIEVIREKVPFPYTLGCVCHHPCEEECRRDSLNDPIAIKELKKFAAKHDSGRWRSRVTVAPETGKKVAMVGSGPAGLTAAWFLRKQGHTVTVFEALPKPGGMMQTGIPAYRLPRDILEKEIKDIENIGVKIKLDTEIDSLDKLFQQGYQAIFLALGAPGGIKMGIPGEDDPRVLDGISVLRSINLGQKIDIAGEIAVVGGGNAAIDTARSVLRLGAKKVTVLYRRTKKEMPAYREEVEETLKEGVKISFLVTPQQIIPRKDKIKVICIRMELGEPDKSSRRRPLPVPGSEFELIFDRLIMAIGQKPLVAAGFGLATNRKGNLQADPDTLACSRQGVFTGGDVLTGPASVIEAIQAGRKAAASIDKYLGGKGQTDQKFVPEEKEDPWLGREEGFADKKRFPVPMLPVDKRCSGFAPVEGCFDKETAQAEARRCLQCQLRLKISRAPLPPPKKEP